MQEITSSRERILKGIRNANLKVDKNKFKDIDHESNIYPSLSDELDIDFAENFTKRGGQFVFCNNENELAANIKALFEKRKLDAFIVKDKSLKQFCSHYGLAFEDEVKENNHNRISLGIADHLIARTGSIRVSGINNNGRELYFGTETLALIAYTNQMKGKIQDSIASIDFKNKEKVSSFYSYISGASRNSGFSIKTENGMYGPKEIILFMLDTN
jgi:L-lactate dehydrogenase complex protein LldG